MAVAAPITITTIISDFLGSVPTLADIVPFEFPAHLQARGLERLERNREDNAS